MHNESSDDEVPLAWEHYRSWNAYLADQWKKMQHNIVEKVDPLPDADYWATAAKSEVDIAHWESGMSPALGSHNENTV